MKKLLIRLGLWIACLGGWETPVCSRTHLEKSTYTRAACIFVKQMEQKAPATSGESKRHQVLRAMLNSFPAAREREVGRAIEEAISLVKR